MNSLLLYHSGLVLTRFDSVDFVVSVLAESPREWYNSCKAALILILWPDDPQALSAALPMANDGPLHRYPWFPGMARQADAGGKIAIFKHFRAADAGRTVFYREASKFMNREFNQYYAGLRRRAIEQYFSRINPMQRQAVFQTQGRC